MDRKHLWSIAHKLRIQLDLVDSRFPPAEHYFDNQDNEIALIYSAKTRRQLVIVFDPPRNWPQEFKDMYVTTNIKEAHR